MDTLYGRWLNVWRKSLTANTQECCEQYWTSPGSSTTQKQELYGHLPPITKTVKIRRTRHVGPCWRSRDELISDVLLWTPLHGRAKAGRPALTDIHQLCANTWCSPEDLLEATDDREGWRERIRDIRADSATWWWWWWFTSLVTWKVFSLKTKKQARKRDVKQHNLRCYR